VVGPPGLWTRKPIRSAADLRGLKIRTAGASGSIARKFGMSSVVLAGGEIIPALERGVIDGAESSTPLLDHQAGLHKVAKYYHYPFWDASSATLVDLIINRTTWDALSKSAQSLIATACREQLLGSLLRIPEDERAGLRLLAKEGASIAKLPGDIAERAREQAWAEIDAAAKQSPNAARLKTSLAAMR
jgi:TRAP-type mannitol/chloroaromatic compound transport system substrate-binding protein